jgi:general secretion pathway protein I
MNSRLRNGGFSLLEVLVAFVVLAMTLSVLLGIFSRGLRSATLSGDYQRATTVAETRLTELMVLQDLRDGTREGSDPPYRWRSTVRVPEWAAEGATRHPLRPYEVTVDVSWDEAGKTRTVSLSTLAIGR